MTAAHCSPKGTWRTKGSFLCLWDSSRNIFHLASADELVFEDHSGLLWDLMDLLLFLGLGVDVPQHSDVWEVYPEFAQQSCHPKGRKKGRELKARFDTSSFNVKQEGLLEFRIQDSKFISSLASNNKSRLTTTAVVTFHAFMRHASRYEKKLVLGQNWSEDSKLWRLIHWKQTYTMLHLCCVLVTLSWSAIMVVHQMS